MIITSCNEANDIFFPHKKLGPNPAGPNTKWSTLHLMTATISMSQINGVFQ